MHASLWQIKVGKDIAIFYNEINGWGGVIKPCKGNKVISRLIKSHVGPDQWALAAGAPVIGGETALETCPVPHWLNHTSSLLSSIVAEGFTSRIYLLSKAHKRPYCAIAWLVGQMEAVENKWTVCKSRRVSFPGVWSWRQLLIQTSLEVWPSGPALCFLLSCLVFSQDSCDICTSTRA